MKSGCGLSGALIVSMLGAALPTETRAADAPSSDVDTLEEVIVTAQRRAERVLDVPASIGVISAADIERLHATSLADLTAAVPGFLVVPLGSPGQAAIVVRGLTAAFNGSAGGAMVATLIDDAPVGSSASYTNEPYNELDLLPYDIERIEILRGPQGTLYGASAMGGVLKYVTRDPNLSAYEAQVGGEVFGIEHGGSIGTGVRGTWSAPLIDGTLAVRASLYDQETPGYMKNPWRGINHENTLSQYGGRVAMLWQPAPQLQVRLQGIYQGLNSGGNAVTFNQPIGTPQDPYYQPGSSLYGDLTYPHPLAEPFSNSVTLISAVIDWYTALANVVAVTSYSSKENSGTQDLTGDFLVPSLPYRERSDDGTRRFSQELRLASPSGQRLEWVAGAYYSTENTYSDQYYDVFDSQLQLIPALNPNYIAHTPSTYTESALFGTLTYPITDRFDLTGGLRWLTNRQKVEFDIPPNYSVPPTNSISRSAESPHSYAFAARWHPQPDAMVYARVANGYRPGTPNQAFPGYPEIPTHSNSDTMVNYEVGVKSELANRKVTLDLDAFKENWTDMQVNVPTADGRQYYTTNAGRVTSEGLEFAATYWPGDAVHLAVNAAYTDVFVTQAVPAGGFFEATRLPMSPRWTAAASMDFRLPNVGPWTAQVSATWRYVSQQYSTLSTMPPVGLLPAYSWVDMELRMSRGRYDVSLYAKNLLDERTFTYGLPGAGVHGEFTFFGTPLEPRVVGLSVTMNL